jgi:hypothetical protein
MKVIASNVIQDQDQMRLKLPVPMITIHAEQTRWSTLRAIARTVKQISEVTLKNQPVLMICLLAQQLSISQLKGIV